MDELLSNDDRAAYLANVLSVARANDADTREKALVLQAIAENQGADQRHFMAAKELFEGEAFRPAQMHSRRRSLLNLQDMIMMALADGAFDDLESRLIEDFAAQLEISQADLDTLLSRAQAALPQVLGAAEAPTPPPLPGSDDDNTPAPAETPPEAAPEPPPPTPEDSEESRPVAEADEQVLACMRAHDESADPHAYCFGAESCAINIWGCRQAGMDWAVGADWLEIGTWRDDCTFVLDRDAIREKLDANLASARICPHLKERYVEAAINVLPRTATIWGHWQYRDTSEACPGAIRVHVDEYIHGVSVSSTRTVCGVDPVGRREALKLIVRAAKRSGVPVPDIDRLRSET